MIWFLNNKARNTGAILPDEKELNKVPQFNEIVARANPVIWKEIDISKLPDYKTRNQDGSSSCVAFSLAFMASVIFHKITGSWVDFSAKWFYLARANYPNEGMIGINAFNIWKTKGAIPDVLMPSDNLPEKDMNNKEYGKYLDDVAKIFSLDSSPIILPPKDIDLLISTLNTTGKPIMVWFKFGNGEWLKEPSVKISNPPYTHSVVAIMGGLYNGKKAIIIKDSWGNDLNTINGYRIITEDFFKERNVFCAYPMSFKFSSVSKKPTYDGTIKSLQDCLKYDGVFPTNIDSTGYFGAITKQAVVDFQKKYKISPTSGFVGQITKAKLKELFN